MDTTGAVSSTMPAMKVSVKVEPLPGSLSTDTSPPISCASCRVIARPSPVPPKRRVIVASACVKVENSRVRTASVMPMPVSLIATLTRHSPGVTSSEDTAIFTLPRSVNLIALDKRLPTHWRTRTGS